MPGIFQKLNLKDQKEILVINAPASFEPELAALQGVATRREIHPTQKIDFALAFVTRQDELNALVADLTRHMPGDATLWFAYPKATSRRYKCEFNRDTGWAALGEAGFEGVRQVAIDEDWSALRFRRVEFIKSLKRDPSRSMTRRGKERTSR